MDRNIKKIYGSSLLSFMENSEPVVAMRRGLLLCIPFFIIGAFCTMFTSFPIEGYQQWLQTFGDGWLYHLLMLGAKVTLGSVTLYVILAVSYSYAAMTNSDEAGIYMLMSMGVYLFFTQENIEEFSFAVFDSNWLFTGLLVTMCSCAIFRKFHSISKKHWGKRHQAGMDMHLGNALAGMAPVLGVALIFIMVKMLMTAVGLDFHNIGSVVMMRLFEAVGTGIVGAVLFIFLIHIMWFFGIHGSNMLYMVAEELFEKGMLENIDAVMAGGEATHLFTKTFFDVFVLMGGSGTTICLLLALLFKKQKKDKVLFKISILPALFNINEIVLFGLPVIFNPVMLIPFVLVPLAMLVVSSLSVAAGLVPIPFVQVAWTTPVLFSGYLSTGSISGTILQVVLLFIGTMIYLPFIRISETYYNKLLINNIQNLKEEMMECEEVGETIDLHKGARSKRDIVKMLTRDLRAAIKNGEIMLYYQPQVTSDETVYGVEALLRWKHPAAGFLYPPLVIELARQDGRLDELGLMIIEKAAAGLEHLGKIVNRPIHMAVNISPVQFESDTFCSEVEAILKKYDFGECILCFEITEQMALSTTAIVSERIERLKKDGIPFHMDDFGMGHSSMKYLQNNEFEAVKLDGSLVRQMMQNDRSQNIISGIQQMALPLKYELIAEYVETEVQREKLRELGCHIYQGALYSWAVPMEELEVFLEKYHACKKES